MASKVRELMSRAHEITPGSPRWEHPFAVIRETGEREPATMIATLPTGGATGDPLLVARVCAVHRRLAAAAVPHVLPIVAVEPAADGLRIVHRRVDAESLSTVLRRGPLSLARTLTILRRLCVALAAAQRLGVDHRALGPGSVLLGAHGEAELWIADFGAADLFAPERASGELGWLPITPEQISGGATATSEDIYLLGCLAHWLLFGRPVFTADDLATLRRRHAIEDPPLLGHSSGRKLPASLALAIARALEKDPDDRFADFEAFEAMLVRAEIESGIVSHEHAVAARPLPPTPLRARPRVPRVSPLLWSGVGALAVGLPLLWSNLTTVPVEMAALPAVVITAGVAPEPCVPEPLPPVPGPLPTSIELAPASFEPAFAEPPPPVTDDALASGLANMATPIVEPAPIAPPVDDITFFETEAAAGRERGSEHPGRERSAELASTACMQVRREAAAARETHDWATLLRAAARTGCWRSIRARTKLRIKALMELKRFDECAEAAARNDHHDPEVARWAEICRRRTAVTG